MKIEHMMISFVSVIIIALILSLFGVKLSSEKSELAAVYKMKMECLGYPNDLENLPEGKIIGVAAKIQVEGQNYAFFYESKGNDEVRLMRVFRLPMDCKVEVGKFYINKNKKFFFDKYGDESTERKMLVPL